MLSILVPVFNEEKAILETLTRLSQTLETLNTEYEIVAINDGSTDGTSDVLKSLSLKNLHILTHRENKGYSASLKYGIRRSRGEIIGIVDADGTYPIEDFPKLFQEMQKGEVDMVVGKRAKENIPFVRKPAKAIVNGLANFLTGMKIPDLNSGMRLFTRELAERFMHLYPQRFSFTMTITLAALTNDYNVVYLPIAYHKRVGKSSMSSGFNGLKHFGQFLSLIVRIVTYFRPLRFFVWPAALLIGGGVLLAAYTLYTESNVSDSGVLLIVSGLQVGLFGLLAEAVVRNRGQ
jgi:glycosyltransferase involved in cell wall biosynthesis